MKIEKAVLGYEPKKFAPTDVETRDVARGELPYRKVKPPPPINDKHRHSFCHSLYSDIHRFISQREWAEILLGIGMAGATQRPRQRRRW